MGTVYWNVKRPRYRFIYWSVFAEGKVKSVWFPYTLDESFQNHIWSALEMYVNGYHLDEVVLEL